MTALLVLPPHLGDLILSLPLIQTASKHADVTVLHAGGVSTQILNREAPNVVPVSLEAWKSVASAKFDLGIAVPNSLRAAWLLSRLKCERRVGVAAQGRSPWLTHRLANQREHLFARTTRLAQAAGWGKPPLPRIEPTERSDGGILWHVGTSRPSKNWPDWPLETLSPWLSQRIPDATLLAPDAALKLPGVVSGRLPWLDWVGLVSRARVVIAPDTSTMHLAAALRRSLVAVFTSTDPSLSGPLSHDGVAQRIVRTQLACQPCHRRRCHFPSWTFASLRCQRTIDPAWVLSLAQSLAPTEANLRSLPTRQA